MNSCRWEEYYEMPAYQKISFQKICFKCNFFPFRIYSIKHLFILYFKKEGSRLIMHTEIKAKQLKTVDSGSKIQKSQTMKLLYDMQNNLYFMETSTGQKINSNRRGRYQTKFLSNFSGFINYKQRFNFSKENPSHMYLKPNLQFQKKYSNPIPSKFQGYTQFPYQLTNTLPSNLIEPFEKQQLYAKQKKQGWIQFSCRQDNNTMNRQNQSNHIFSNTKKQDKFESMFNYTENLKKKHFKRKLFTSDCIFREDKRQLKNKKYFQTTNLLKKQESKVLQVDKNEQSTLNYSQSSKILTKTSNYFDFTKEKFNPKDDLISTMAETNFFKFTNQFDETINLQDHENNMKIEKNQKQMENKMKALRRVKK